jgi:magnesium transporter
MTTEFLTAEPGETREQIVQHLRMEQEEIETVQTILVCGPRQRLLGLLGAQELLAAHPHETAAEIMDAAVVTVVPTMDQEVCANLMQKYDLMILPVVDVKGRPIGIITHDDILDVIGDEAEEDMYRLVGVGDDRPLEHGPFVRAFKRLPWLATTLIGMGLVGPLIMHYWFQATLDEIVILAFFIPAIMGLGGNTATQSSTITVRGLATEEIEFSDIWWMIRRESLVALIIAVVCTVVIVLFSYAVAAAGLGGEEGAFSASRLAATVGLAMFTGIMVSVVLGTSIPMLCHRAGVDPALAAGPFITTLIDLSTQVIYLGLATWLLLGTA